MFVMGGERFARDMNCFSIDDAPNFSTVLLNIDTSTDSSMTFSPFFREGLYGDRSRAFFRSTSGTRAGLLCFTSRKVTDSLVSHLPPRSRTRPTARHRMLVRSSVRTNQTIHTITQLGELVGGSILITVREETKGHATILLQSIGGCLVLIRVALFSAGGGRRLCCSSTECKHQASQTCVCSVLDE